jgi:hypothetical protein
LGVVSDREHVVIVAHGPDDCFGGESTSPALASHSPILQT